MRRAVLMAVLAMLSACASVQHPPSLSTSAAAPFEHGFFVKRYPDGSASVALGPEIGSARWSIDCGIDAMTDARECSISSMIGGPFIFYGAHEQPQSVCIIGHDFPGRTGQIRIDDNVPLTTDREGCVAASRVLEQMRSGSKITMRRIEWPYDYSRDQVTSLEGFNKALSVVAEIRRGDVGL